MEHDGTRSDIQCAKDTNGVRPDFVWVNITKGLGWGGKSLEEVVRQ